MKNKIIAFMLAVLTVLTSCIVAIPAAASSADADPVYVSATNSAMNSNYATAEEKVQDEITLGYTYLYAKNDQFELYANKYTGEVYLKNVYTGQYLTTNPIDVAKPSSFGNVTEQNKFDMLSQIWISYTDILSGQQYADETSFKLAAQKGQISISKIKNGIRVEYVLGDTVSRYAVPEAIMHEDYLETIIIPMQTSILDVFENLVTDFPTIVGSNTSAYDKCQYEGELGDISAFSSYRTSIFSIASGTFSSAYRTVYNKAQSDSALYDQLLYELRHAGVIDEHATELPTYNMFRKWISGIPTDYQTLVSFYTKYDGNTIDLTEELLKVYPVLDDEDPETGLKPVIWVLDGTTLTNKKIALQNIITSVNTGYTVDDMLKQEAKVGFKYAEKPRPVFRCALEYVIDEEGMTFTLPANSISFDESKYRLDGISILRYFAANDRNEKGYLFYPDGSGALINNEDLTSTVIKQPVYGYDYAYSTIEGKKTQFVRLPVYGAVNTDADTGITTGFFAIITEGDSLVTLSSGVRDKSPRHLATFQSYVPRPTDIYSISGASNIPIFSKIKYTGNYSTKVVMLYDPTLVSLIPSSASNAYTASYVEMARYYRDYLINVTETLTELTDSDVKSRIPLFIESYGTLETTQKILTFPVEVDVALTTFKDVQTMHSELSAAGIGNIKFRLMGFYNEGVEGKYPKRLKLMRQVGGKKGLKKLLSYAEDNASSGIEVILSVDMMYNYVYWGVGGISKKKTTVRSMDNRYASKQMYDTVYQGFFSYFSLCVSADQLSGLFNKFNKKLSKFDLNGLSLDYMAEDLSSNFDEDNSFGREAAKGYLVSTLENISSKYSTILSTGGNYYALKYLDYLLNAPVDSSRYFCASRTVPFYGMVMHGSLEYAGTPFNETGNPEYEILRAIESGAAMYYVLCYRNTDLMKEDFLLSKHYSANYEIWKSDVIRYYNILDYAIGDLQTWQLYDHQFLITERVITDDERAASLAKLEDEYFALLLAQHEETLTKKGALVRELIKAGKAIAADPSAEQTVLDELAAQIVGGLDADIAESIAALRAADAALTDGSALKKLVDDGDVLLTDNQQLHFTYDRSAILADIAEGFGISFAAADLAADSVVKAAYDRISARLDAFIAANSTASGNIAVAVSCVENYESLSKLSYFTNSLSTDVDYKATDFTLDDGSVVMVTYKKGNDTVRLLLNFSIFTVQIELEGQSLTLDKYQFVRLDARADGMADPR